MKSWREMLGTLKGPDTPTATAGLAEDKVAIIGQLLSLEDPKTPGTNYLALLKKTLKNDPRILDANNGLVYESTAEELTRAVVTTYVSSLSEKQWSNVTGNYYPQMIYDALKDFGVIEATIQEYLATKGADKLPSR